MIQSWVTLIVAVDQIQDEALAVAALVQNVDLAQTVAK